jgi:hypothetical protein
MKKIMFLLSVVFVNALAMQPREKLSIETLLNKEESQQSAEHQIPTEFAATTLSRDAQLVPQSPCFAREFFEYVKKLEEKSSSRDSSETIKCIYLGFNHGTDWQYCSTVHEVRHANMTDKRGQVSHRETSANTEG